MNDNRERDRTTRTLSPMKIRDARKDAVIACAEDYAAALEAGRTGTSELARLGGAAVAYMVAKREATVQKRSA